MKDWLLRCTRQVLQLVLCQWEEAGIVRGPGIEVMEVIDLPNFASVLSSLLTLSLFSNARFTAPLHPPNPICPLINIYHPGLHSFRHSSHSLVRPLHLQSTHLPPQSHSTILLISINTLSDLQSPEHTPKLHKIHSNSRMFSGSHSSNLQPLLTDCESLVTVHSTS